MAEIRGKYVFDDSLRPGLSEDGEGLSQLLFDGRGRLADHAVFVPEDDGEDWNHMLVVYDVEDGAPPDGVTQVVGAIIGVAVVAVAAEAAPHAKKWLLDKVGPRLRKLVSRRREPAAVTPSVLTASPVDFSRAVEAAVKPPADRMSSAEAGERLAAVLAAAAFIADQIRALQTAHVDGVDAAELRRAMGRLTTRQVTDALNRMLEADASLLDQKTSDEFMRVFGGGQRVAGRYVPIRNERVRDVLRLTPGESEADDDGASPFAPV